MKILKLIFLAVIAGILAVALLYFFAGKLLKEAIHRGAPSIAGVDVGIENLVMDPLRGKVAVEQMTVQNPDGFKSTNAFELGKFLIDFDATTTFGGAFHIHSLVIENASILCDGLLADNHRAILGTIRERLGSQTTGKPGSSKPETDPQQGRKVIIDSFTFRNSTLVITVDGEEITKVAFPEIRLQEIGTKGHAVTATEALAQIYGAITSETTRVLTINRDVIDNLARAKLKKFGIDDIRDLKDPEKLLKDPKTLDKLLDNLLATPPPERNG
jgi:hypothetical protein